MIHVDKDTGCQMTGTVETLLTDLANATTGIYRSLADDLGEELALDFFCATFAAATKASPESFTKVSIPMKKK